ncbi:MAG TPA: BolA family protein [Candidatus Competibacteraceae bacterium]|nr:BolA family transcriptional regulator [Candidatus Competibacteraceae bacterium]MCP5132577.1 BolA family transcriptional regulator [Gammaproteobacteria bacterium]HPF57652.1 BolA family protein [Candidatus Competibacteraceae bacterium]HRY16963.1 BolA family protein [Candidatus Competibacteraceae bacterium]
MSERIALIEERLRAALAPDSLEIIDDSAAHAGHAGAREGGHFTVSIISTAFAGKTLIQRHRLVYAAVADLMHGEIHALSIAKARTPGETRP